ncbi:squamosa promoter-binding-like protein 1 isoform X2 [Selaginella moellendorffii]|uniref:squamosa promoter-binding-like protein 1 isoform X2 n=1 Tax=Selaginella moellendorffii TaxID=88036 RepID=UPI000D1C2EDB|nr:squamosa promoter-binding-like protein 1 isoform X2 [Selaginella moellendorffii]|eukprot:XP_024526237.1 squamosa promoter-binding-like protein 1 isoform X2 [Selaginella moellendorffii]
MESEPGVTLGTSYYQHQFFPGGDLSLAPDPGEVKWGRYVETRGPERNDWDVKAWNWDSLLFLAQPSSADKAGSNTQLDHHHHHAATPATGLSLKRDQEWLASSPMNATKTIVLDASSTDEDDAECLTLKLGGRTYSSTDESARNGKRQRSTSPGSSCQQPQQPQQQQQQSQQQQYPMCQVDDCKADLSNAKDYHRRHKVCEMHSKAAKALVSRNMQRFCQQCSRFHPLQEFDEGKRSCRRRLAGHNRRRRKTQPDAAAAQAFLLSEDDVAGKSAGLLKLLQVLSQLQASALEKANAVQERDLALEYLRRAVSVSTALGDCSKEGNGFGQKPEVKSPYDAQVLSALPGLPLLDAFSVLLQNNLKAQAKELPAPVVSQPLQNGTDYLPRGSHAPPPPTSRPAHSVIEVDGPSGHKPFPFQSPVAAAVNKAAVAPDSRDAVRPSLLGLLGARDRPPSPAVPPTSFIQAGHSQQSSESQSGSEQSPDSSYADWQERTGRISFKLFDRNPGDFPQLLRAQILEWLSHVPSDMESYIRPGCVVLAIFLSMPNSAWQKLCNDLLGNLKRLIDSSPTDFWNKGRILVQVCDQSAYVVDGKVQAVSLKSRDFPEILAVRPLAAVRNEETRFLVHGVDLAGADTRIYCAFHDEYNLQSWSEIDANEEDAEGSLCFTHTPCESIGRCFIEVERNGGSSFAPVLVADNAICDEVRSLEEDIEIASSRAGAMADSCAFPEEYSVAFVDLVELAVEHETSRFLHELGWVFQKQHWQLMKKQDHCDLRSSTMKWLLMFAVEREWCAVVKALLDTLYSFQSTGKVEDVADVLESVNLLHRATSRNSITMVEFLLTYQSPVAKRKESYVFSAATAGPAGLTALHVAACMIGADRVVSALTSDASQVGLQSWNSARDINGQSPFDCALSHGNFTYIQLVWSKIAASRGKSIPSQATNWIQNALSIELPPWPSSSTQTPGGSKVLLPASCGSECVAAAAGQHPVRQNFAGIRGPMYRPFILSMVAIAAVCVCVCLLLKSPVEVRFISPFTWESVQFGPK